MSAEYSMRSAIEESGVESGPGGYPYGDALALPEHLQDEELFSRPSWERAKEVLAGSFVVSGGRQGNQFGDQIAAALLEVEEGGEADLELLDSDLTRDAVRSWKIPGAHTKAPEHVAGQVAGVYHFWLLAQRDAARLVHTPDYILPSESELEDRYELECRVPPITTSSTTDEEFAVIARAYWRVANDHDVIRGGLDRFLLVHVVPQHINGVLHWEQSRRPRRDGGDRHEALWKTCVEYAVNTAPEERTFYNRLLVRQGQAMQRLLTMPADELEVYGLERVRRRHDQAVALYNQRHPDQEPLVTLLDGISLPEPQSAPKRCIAGPIGRYVQYA